MLAFILEVLPEKFEKLSKSFRHAVRRFYLRKQLKSKYGRRKNAITKQQRKEAKQYWSRYTKHFSPLWHELLTAQTGVFDVRYVPVDLQFTEIEDHLNDWNSAHGIDNKNNYAMYFPEIRHPKSVFRKMAGLYHADDYSIISKEQAIQNCIDCGDVIFKVALESGKGYGISFWKTEDGKEALLQMLDELPEETNAQEYIRQHPDMAKMNPSSCNTIRVVTYANEKGVRVLSSYFQAGTSENVRMGKANLGGLCAAIKPDGYLYPMAYDTHYEGREMHPCGIRFADFRVPSYDKVCDAVVKLATKMGDFKIISWDLTVGEDGEPVFIEMNLKYGGTMFQQLSAGPLFGDDSDEILNEIYGKKN